jgi:hypothetical protein
VSWAAYRPKRSEHVVLIELEDASQNDLLALLSAIETCLSANDIETVRLDLDGKHYLFFTAK